MGFLQKVVIKHSQKNNINAASTKGSLFQELLILRYSRRSLNKWQMVCQKLSVLKAT